MITLKFENLNTLSVLCSWHLLPSLVKQKKIWTFKKSDIAGSSCKLMSFYSWYKLGQGVTSTEKKFVRILMFIQIIMKVIFGKIGDLQWTNYLTPGHGLLAWHPLVHTCLAHIGSMLKWHVIRPIHDGRKGFHRLVSNGTNLPMGLSTSVRGCEATTFSQQWRVTVTDAVHAVNRAIKGGRYRICTNRPQITILHYIKTTTPSLQGKLWQVSRERERSFRKQKSNCSAKFVFVCFCTSLPGDNSSLHCMQCKLFSWIRVWKGFKFSHHVIYNNQSDLS